MLGTLVKKFAAWLGSESFCEISITLITKDDALFFMGPNYGEPIAPRCHEYGREPWEEKVMKLTRSITMVAIVILGLGISQLAFADTCVSNWNVQQLNDAGAQVCYDLTGGTLSVTSFDAGTLSNSLKTFSEIGTNGLDFGSATFLNLWDPGTSPGSFNIDGFGLFSWDLTHSNSDPNQVPSFDVASGITGSVSSIVLHVQFNGNCSGFVGSGTSNDVSSNGNCGGTSTPEPASMALIGAGLGALGLWRVRRIRK